MEFGKNKGTHPATAFDHTGKRLTILSIDGGGVRGIIPAKILEALQGYLKELDTGEHHLWEYFDMIAGTSTGGLITAMITTPNADYPQLPTCDATQVVEFFRTDAPKIFRATFTNKCRLRWLLEGFASLLGSIYSARPLEDLLLATFRNACLSEALTSVIIPAFDTRDQVPVFFSNLQGVDEANPLYNVHVKDACRATTAVPIFFPPARFKDQNQPGRSKVFNVIDGGIAVNDPTFVAVTQAIVQERQAIEQDNIQITVELEKIKGQASEAEQQTIKECLQKNMKERSRDCTDFSNVLVLSLGTGQHRMRFLANPHWSSVQWLLNRSGSPLLSSFLLASEDMVEYYTSMIFDPHKSGRHYLRIQTELSESEFLKIDDGTKENLKQLELAEEELVRFHNVSRRNFAPRTPEDETDCRKALYSFARLLVEERLKLVHSGEGESSRSVKLRGEFGRTRRRIPRDENRGPDIDQLRVGWFCLVMTEAIVAFVYCACLFFLLLQDIYGVVSKFVNFGVLLIKRRMGLLS